MTKLKLMTTRKEILNCGKPVYYTLDMGTLDMGSLHELLNYTPPIAYTCGVYGWNCDVYDMGRCVITEGYRPFGTFIPSDVQKRYAKLAAELPKLPPGKRPEEDEARMGLYKALDKELYDIYTQYAQEKKKEKKEEAAI